MFKVTFCDGINILCVVYVRATDEDDAENQIEPLVDCWYHSHAMANYEIERE